MNDNYLAACAGIAIFQNMDLSILSEDDETISQAIDMIVQALKECEAHDLPFFECVARAEQIQKQLEDEN